MRPSPSPRRSRDASRSGSRGLSSRPRGRWHRLRDLRAAARVRVRRHPRAGAALRGARLLVALALRPPLRPGAPGRRRRSKAGRSRPRCSRETERLRVGHLVLCNDVPPPGAAREDGHDARRDLGWSPRPRDRQRLLRARARAGRDPVGHVRGALGAARRDARDHHADVRRGAHDVRGQALPAARHARTCPRPVQQPRPPIHVGGVGERRTLPLVARYADVWNVPTYALGELDAQARRARRGVRAHRARPGDDPDVDRGGDGASPPDDAALAEAPAKAERRFAGARAWGCTRAATSARRPRSSTASASGRRARRHVVRVLHAPTAPPSRRCDCSPTR